LLRWISYCLAAIVIALVIAGAYLGIADLGRHKDQLTTLASNALGRELRVDGNLSLHLGRTVTLRAADVSIANAPWASEPYLLEAAGVQAEVDFWSLIRGPARIESLALLDAVIRLKKTDDGRHNWARPSTETANADNGRTRDHLPRITTIKASDVRILLTAPELTGVSEFIVDNAAYAAADTLINANISGTVNGHPLEIETDILPAKQPPAAGDLRVDADIRMGEVNLLASISLDHTNELAVSSAELELSGPNIDDVFRILQLPRITSGPLAIRANLTPDPQRSDFSAEGKLGEYDFSANGWLKDIRGMGGFEMSLRLSGPSLAALGKPFDFQELPASPFDVDTKIRSVANGIEFDETRVRFGEAQASGTGTVVWLQGGAWELDVRADYRDISSTLLLKIPADWPASDLNFDFGIASDDVVVPARYLGLDHLDGQPLIVTGNGTYGGRKVSLREARIDVGAQKLALSGRAEFVPSAPEIDLRLDVENLDLSPWLTGNKLLETPLRTLSGTGRLRISDGKLEAEELALRSSDVSLRGRVSMPVADRGKTGEFAMRLGAPAIDRLFPALASDAFQGQPVDVSASGRFRGPTFSLREAGVRLGEQEVKLTGRALLVDDAAEIDFRFDGEHIDLSSWLAGTHKLDARLRNVAGTGRLRVSRSRLEVDELALRSGDVSLNGRVSLPLSDRGSAGAFTLHLASPTVNHLFPGLKGDLFEKEPLDIQGDGHWTRNGWQLHELLWRLPGHGDLRGNISFTGNPAPSVRARLNAESLDLRPASTAKPAAPAAAVSDRLIPAREIVLPWPTDLRADLRVDIGSLQSPVTAGASLVLEARLANNRLRVDRLETEGKRGEILASFTVEEDPASALKARLELHGQKLYIAAPDEPAASLRARPRFDLKTTLQAKGATFRELAETLDGRLMIQAEEGTITRRGGALVTLVMDDFLTQTLETINPLIKERDEVQLNCFVVFADIQKGKVRGAPLIALQTPEVNLFTHGEIDLASETLQLDIDTRPRRGLGISLGDIVNPFTRIGATLAAPRLVADPGPAVFETGAGILTGGAWVIAKKFRDRFFTGNPCVTALKQIDESK